MKTPKATTKTAEQQETVEQVTDQYTLILYNDDVNTFDFVIRCLIDICSCESLQAEQIAYIVHYKGRCDVQRGEWDEIEPLCHALLDKGLTASIDE